MKKSKQSYLIVGVAFFSALIIGYFGVNLITPQPHENLMSESRQSTSWTCSMHPQVRKTQKGKCPICAMDLIPVEQDPIENTAPNSTTKRKIKYWVAPMDPSYKRDKPGKSPMGMELVPVYETNNVDNSPVTLKLSSRAEKLAEVEVSPVRKEFATQKLRLFGKLSIDETRVETVSARFPGRVEQLFIDSTGIRVNKDDHMASIYSPELLIAQKELLEAIRTGATHLASSSRQKLKLWGFTPTQIRKIESTGQVSNKLTIYTPIGGTILEKSVKEGDYVMTGTKLFQIADLSRLWLLGEAYEADLSKLYYGQNITFSTEAYPGESFNATVTFIDPVVNPQSRTIRIRAVVQNRHGKLKPEMLTKADVHVSYGAHGPIGEGQASPLYVCPMHPEEFSPKPGNCPICGMAMKKSSDLGLTKASSHLKKPLIIPSSAPLITGKRAVVYVRDKDSGVYEGRVVELGARVGDYYIVKSGLEEGELVVTKGNFKIDSAMQIQAKSSMMQSEGGAKMTGHNH